MEKASLFLKKKYFMSRRKASDKRQKLPFSPRHRDRYIPLLQVSQTGALDQQVTYSQGVKHLQNKTEHPRA